MKLQTQRFRMLKAKISTVVSFELPPRERRVGEKKKVANFQKGSYFQFMMYFMHSNYKG